MSRAQTRKLLQVTEIEQIEETSSFVMIVAITSGESRSSVISPPAVFSVGDLFFILTFRLEDSAIFIGVSDSNLAENQAVGRDFRTV